MLMSAMSPVSPAMAAEGSMGGHAVELERVTGAAMPPCLLGCWAALLQRTSCHADSGQLQGWRLEVYAISRGPTCDQPSGNSPHTIMYRNHKTAHRDSLHQCLLVGRCW